MIFTTAVYCEFGKKEMNLLNKWNNKITTTQHSFPYIDTIWFISSHPAFNSPYAMYVSMIRIPNQAVVFVPKWISLEAKH